VLHHCAVLKRILFPNGIKFFGGRDCMIVGMRYCIFCELLLKTRFSIYCIVCLKYFLCQHIIEDRSHCVTHYRASAKITIAPSRGFNCNVITQTIWKQSRTRMHCRGSNRGQMSLVFFVLFCIAVKLVTIKCYIGLAQRRPWAILTFRFELPY
jgi:hypothetical protein